MAVETAVYIPEWTGWFLWPRQFSRYCGYEDGSFSQPRCYLERRPETEPRHRREIFQQPTFCYRGIVLQPGYQHADRKDRRCSRNCRRIDRLAKLGQG